MVEWCSKKKALKKKLMVGCFYFAFLTPFDQAINKSKLNICCVTNYFMFELYKRDFNHSKLSLCELNDGYDYHISYENFLFKLELTKTWLLWSQLSMKLKTKQIIAFTNKTKQIQIHRLGCDEFFFTLIW